MGHSEGISEEKQSDQPQYVFSLYVTGASPNSSRAILNLNTICETYFQGRYQIQVIDIYQQPELAYFEDLLVAPTLVKLFPLPVRRMVGDLSNRSRVLIGLGLLTEFA